MPENNGISTEELRKILADQAKQNAEQTAEIIRELKKPTVLEQRALDREQKEIQDKNEERKANAGAMLQKDREKKFTQATCSHKHRDGNTHCVFVMEKAPSPGYILCQKNQCIIRPGTRPEGYGGSAIYDTDMFNRLFQELPTNELFA